MTTQLEAETAGDDQTWSERLVLLQPRDPLVLRDARPFAAEPGAHAFSLSWPLPRTIAGTMRTHVGNTADPALVWTSHADTQRARGIVSHGPLMAVQAQPGIAWRVHVPAPRDVVFYRDLEQTLQAMVLRPAALGTGEGCDLPRPAATDSAGIKLALGNTELLPLTVTDDAKPDHLVPPYWDVDDAARWLNTATADHAALPISETAGQTRIVRGRALPPVDTRVHVSIRPDVLTNRDGALFVTEARAFREIPDPDAGDAALGLLCRVGTGLSWSPASAVVPLGGERRPCALTVASPLASWPPVQYPAAAELEQADGLRLLLVTPALFSHGWLPGWMADGAIPGLRGLKVGVKLVGAAIDRRIPVSGWRLAQRQRPGGADPVAEGPRATRYAVPAGGVYFLELANGAKPTADVWKQIWDRLWLMPIADRNDDRNDGFGLVLPGLWRYPDDGAPAHHVRTRTNPTGGQS